MGNCNVDTCFTVNASRGKLPSTACTSKNRWTVVEQQTHNSFYKQRIPADGIAANKRRRRPDGRETNRFTGCRKVDPRKEVIAQRAKDGRVGKEIGF